MFNHVGETLALMFYMVIKRKVCGSFGIPGNLGLHQNAFPKPA